MTDQTTLLLAVFALSIIVLACILWLVWQLAHVDQYLHHRAATQAPPSLCGQSQRNGGEQVDTRSHCRPGLCERRSGCFDTACPGHPGRISHLPRRPLP